MNKKLVIISMCIAIIVMTIGYSAFVSNIKINGTANVTSTWNILFTKIEQVSIKGGAVEKTPPEATGTLATFDIGLISPGDEIVYQITVENKGSLNAIINKINATQLGSDAIEFIIEGIKEGDKLPHGEKTTFTVTIKFKEEVTKDPNLKDNELQIDITYVQDLSDKEQKDPSIIPTRLSQKILYDNEEKADTGINFGEISSESNGKGLYYTNKNTEDNRVTYYFRGAVDNNYVSFAGYYWRIIRINEDGSIRLIYQGKTADATGSNAQIDNYIINYRTGDNAYVGYMLGTPTTYHEGVGNYGGWVWRTTTGTNTVKMGTGYTFDEKTGKYTLTGVVDGTYSEEYYDYFTCNDGAASCITLIKLKQTKKEGDTYQMLGGEIYSAYFSTSYEEAHKNENSSAMKNHLEEWYGQNLLKYKTYITDTGFCNDRSLASGKGYKNIATHYGAYDRLKVNEKPNPQFSCPQKNDLFTVNNSKGNGALTYPIGLITADEVAYAGGSYSANTNYYLYTGSLFWTMSPVYFREPNAFPSAQVMYIGSSGQFIENLVWNALGVRPVINLKADIEITDITQNGTINSPYIVKTTN